MNKSFETRWAQREAAAKMIQVLVQTIREDQVVQGESYEGATAYTLGYIESMFAQTISLMSAAQQKRVFDDFKIHMNAIKLRKEAA